MSQAAPSAGPPSTPPAVSCDPTDAAWAQQATLDIWARLASRGFTGWDPYDALNTRLIPKVFTSPRLVSRLLTQAVKHCPVPLQPLLAIRREVDAYTLGHVLLAAARLREATSAELEDDETLDLAIACQQVVLRLRDMTVAEGDSLAWGYHFPVHTRFFSYAPPTPNLIVTAFVAKGMAAATRAGLVDCAADVRGAVDFILGHLPRISDHTGDCIGYVPGENAVVHNANMLAAMVLCEGAQLAADLAGRASDGPGSAADSWRDQALRCARYTAARQSSDGSWPYSEESCGRWVDGFHTGFVLEGLAAVVRATGVTDLRETLRRGLRFYVAQLFGPCGQPKYYPARAYPLDALSAAQGVETLQVALRGTALGDGAAQAIPGQLEWVRDYLVRPSGKVAYQVHRLWTDRREFPRWASAPLMSALAGVVPETVCEPCTESCTNACTESCTEFAPRSADGSSGTMTVTPEAPTHPVSSARAAHQRRPTLTGPVWIDLANSPHVLFFQPVIAELHRRGIPTVLSARDFAQTIDLCHLLGVEAQVIGSHGGAGLVGKASDLVGRVRALRAFARRTTPAVAVSHNSYAQAVAGRTLGIPVVTAMDYEFQPANHLAFRCASLVAVPDVFPLDALRRQGAKLSKVWRYSGLKEEIALAGFVPDPGYLEHASILTPAADTGPHSVGGPAVVVARPPADMALYHRFANPLFTELLNTLQERQRSGSARVLLLARSQTQTSSLEAEGFGDLLWRGQALDGRRLIAAADAVISAGGSMNREAAVLGTPAYSVYAGKLAAVDRALVAEGRLRLLRSQADIAALSLPRKPRLTHADTPAPPAPDYDLVIQFVDKLLQVAGA